MNPMNWNEEALKEIQLVTGRLASKFEKYKPITFPLYKKSIEARFKNLLHQFPTPCCGFKANLEKYLPADIIGEICIDWTDYDQWGIKDVVAIQVRAYTICNACRSKTDFFMQEVHTLQQLQKDKDWEAESLFGSSRSPRKDP